MNESQLYSLDKKILTTFLEVKPVSFVRDDTCLFLKMFGYFTEGTVATKCSFFYLSIIDIHFVRFGVQW